MNSVQQQDTPLKSAHPFRCASVNGSHIYTSCGTVVLRSAGLALPRISRIFYARRVPKTHCWVQASA
ncbi:hypothetical protein [Ramlibacter rhizophilus]|uniref:Uncharacterized protein n=1 Tax=Ramlibacter rhizophilus TaxID=1781167 RepID=A0A4Z0C0S2_9BURK|nr:hypothetical protein [Ramlibacter rhizophilus]TFZ04811.1 hypothetical protein EZ242_03410 [Ramlibacter rhizophilus]